MKYINQNQLKLIAIVAMTVNHIGYIINFNNPIWDWFYLLIGKITFPIMAYFLVEGNKYTSNWLSYAKRLFILMIISILPYHYTLDNQQGLPYIFNNIFFVLLVGLIMIRILDSICALRNDIIKQPLIMLLVILCMTITVKSDWAVLGVYLIYLMYIRNDVTKSIIIAGTIITVMEAVSREWYVALSNIGFIIPILLINYYKYDVTKKNKLIQYGFYLYYPLHLIVLRLIL